MSETTHPTGAGDLLVHGTFVLRRTLDRLAHPIRRALPASRPEPPEAQREDRRPAVADTGA
jgi:hypothetical protein